MVFAFHDDTLLRMTGEDIAINALDAADIDSITVAGGHAIPRMEDLLEAFPECRFNIDAKAWPVVEPLDNSSGALRSITEYALAHLMMSGFSRFASLLAGPCVTVSGYARSSRFRLAAWLGLNAYFTAGCVQFPVNRKGVSMVTPASVAHAHKLGLQVHAWTINDNQPCTI